MTDTRSFVIVGASLAGAKAAETLRAEGFEGRIVLVGEEPVRPYERPPLTKHFLQGVAGGHRLFIHDDGYYVEHAIELRLSTRVTALETGERRVALESGETIGYDAVLLATGAEARRIRIPGSELSGVHYLRSLADAEALKETLSRVGRVVVVGAGWIGCEAAASAREMGVRWQWPRPAGCRWSGCSAPRWAPSSATCTPTGEWSCTSGSGWRRSAVGKRWRRWCSPTGRSWRLRPSW